MAKNCISDVSWLAHKLKQQGVDYLSETSLPAESVDLHFIGRFAQQEVVWNARLMTLDYCGQQQEMPNDPMQFIDIQQKQGCLFIDIALNLPIIDQAAIQRTIIMVRKYKRLRPGRHEFAAASRIRDHYGPVNQ